MQRLKVTRPMMRGADVEVFQVLVTQAGHDCGAVDRIYGPKCEAACRAYQRAQGLAVDGICGPKTWQKLLCGQQNEPQTPHFTLREWRCKDGSDVPRTLWANLQRLMERLETLRSALGDAPITIVSGYRSPAYNERLRQDDPAGVAKDSQHLYATAADIRVRGCTPQQVYEQADAIFADGGVGRYSSFVHVDVRGKRARWNRS